MEPSQAPKPNSRWTDEGISEEIPRAWCAFMVLVKGACVLAFVGAALHVFYRDRPGRPRGDRIETVWEQELTPTATEPGEGAKLITVPADGRKTSETAALVDSASAKVPVETAVERARKERARGKILPLETHTKKTNPGQPSEDLNPKTQER